MVYQCFCLTCKKRGEEEGQERLALYHGRTSRCFVTRQKEHFDGQAAKKEDNALWKHQELFHAEEECKFEFTAEKFFHEPVMHQIYEGLWPSYNSSRTAIPRGVLLGAVLCVSL